MYSYIFNYIIIIIIIIGWLYKKGGAVNERGGFRNWKKRYFVLNPIDYRGGKGYELQYFTDNTRTKLKGVIALSGVEIYCEEKSRHKKIKFEFQIVLQNGSILQLSSDDENERDDWIDTLNMVVAYLKRLSIASTSAIDGYDPVFEDDEHSYMRGEEIAKNSNAYGPGLFGAEAGQKGHFMIQLNNMKGKKMDKGGMPITIMLQNDEALYYIKVRDNEDGTYSAHYAIGRPGLYHLHIRLNDEHEIFGSPFELEILPSRTIPERCTAEGVALTMAATNQVSSFTITARDSFGNKKTRGGDPFEVGIMGPAQLKAVEDNSDGTYSCFFEAHSTEQISYLTPSSLLILVTLNGRHIRGSPFRPAVVVERSQPGSKQSKISNNAYSASEAKKKSSNSSPGIPSHPKRGSIASDVTDSPPPPPPANDEINVRKSVKVVEDPSLSSMSKLERARQRAAQARNLNVSSNVRGDDSTIIAEKPIEAKGQQIQKSRQDDINEITKRLGKLDAMTKNVGATAGSKLATLSKSQGNNQLISNTFNQSTELQFNSASIIADLLLGLIDPQPPTLSKEERNMWEQANSALTNMNVIEILSAHLGTIKFPFDCLSELIEGVQVIKLTNSSSGGFYRLLEEYDITPAYISKKDIKLAFMIILASQRNARSPASLVGGGSGLDFANFIKLMVLIAVVSLSTASSFSSLYSSYESRVEVMLFKWGLSEPLKLQLLKSNLRQR